MTQADASVPVEIREAVDLRDGEFCRFCGVHAGERRVHHHIRYGGDERGMGGRRLHDVGNIVTLCGSRWRGEPCHDIVHRGPKLEMALLLEAAIRNPGTTVVRLMRRRKRHAARVG